MRALTFAMRTEPTSLSHLPPPFRLIRLREVGDAFAHAKAVAGTDGAGTLVHVGRFDLVEFAVVLEPEESLHIARTVLYAGVNALVEALLGYAPPERPITVAWPDTLLVDGGLMGGVRLGWPDDAQEDDVPDWLVFGAMIRTAAMGKEDAGLVPLAAALEDEGFADLGSGRLVASFAHHLMANLDLWQSERARMLGDNYLWHLNKEKGATLSLAGNGDLLLKWPGADVPERRSLREAIAAPSWLDPVTQGPRS